MVYITHIRLSGGRGVQHITHVRWEQPSTSKSGTATRAEVVQHIRNGIVAYVSDGVRDVKVEDVDTNPTYIRTVADGRETNNLLSLPHF